MRYSVFTDVETEHKRSCSTSQKSNPQCTVLYWLGLVFWCIKYVRGGWILQYSLLPVFQGKKEEAVELALVINGQWFSYHCCVMTFWLKLKQRGKGDSRSESLQMCWEGSMPKKQVSLPFLLCSLVGFYWLRLFLCHGHFNGTTTVLSQVHEPP